MTSHEFASFLQAYCDSELEASKMLEVEAHLEACSSCRRTVEIERAFRGELRRRIPPEPVPPHLQERLKALLGELHEKERRPPSAFRRLGWRVAASFLLVVLGGLLAHLLSQPGSRPGLSPLLLELIREHGRSVSQEKPVELYSKNTTQVALWFQGKIAHPILVPDYDPMGVQLLGGRVIQFGNRRVASVVYEKGRTKISLFAFSGAGDTTFLTDLREIRRDGQIFLAVEFQGQQMLLWDREEMVYAMVSDVGWDPLFECARVFFETRES
jgi:anti-sigma factor RsiW